MPESEQRGSKAVSPRAPGAGASATGALVHYIQTRVSSRCTAVSLASLTTDPHTALRAREGQARTAHVRVCAAVSGAITLSSAWCG
jgi:hypothetical protein